jgi:signal transduction histidine kinase
LKLQEISSYLFVPEKAENAEHHLLEMKRLEWIFIGVRWLWVPIIIVLAFLHHPPQMKLMMILGGVLGLGNIVTHFLNVKLKTPGSQQTLGIAMLVFDTLIAWGIILVFAQDFYTAAYASFVYIIIEAAIRFGMAGSIIMVIVFILGLYGAFMYRSVAFDTRFSFSGYIFWTVLMIIVAIAVGAIVNEGKKQRALSQSRLRENVLLSERNRLARELHDTVLKTLHGLSLEARALADRTETTRPSVRETAQYIEEVCSRTGHEIREVIFALRSEISLTGIGFQISNILEEWNKTTGITGNFSLTGKDLVLPPETTRQVRNIVSEALTNIQRHASASGATILVAISPDVMTIEISDNGHGLERSAEELHAYVAEGKLGIAGMRERTELLGGHFSLSSDRNGTCIGIKVPTPASS